ncbi:hypothetical protein CAEBREN_03697 [Caenorhabditis brenneri]|uniref:Uncharacterized protein n=1 Tax=Caenorhabditis brenneri TaxID=135651 RepID=G0P504_CAEBE|nr:hypothetical protein CAEBREN_03697 [Caenorhabditis brenneri]
MVNVPEKHRYSDESSFILENLNLANDLRFKILRKMSESETSDVGSDVESESEFIKRQTEQEKLFKDFCEWREKSEKAFDELFEKYRQRDGVESTLLQLSKMVKKKEKKLERREKTFAEMADGQRMEIAEIKDDIKMMGEIMKVKQSEKGQLDQEAKVLRKRWKDVCRHQNKLEEELNSVYEKPKRSEKNADENAK